MPELYRTESWAARAKQRRCKKNIGSASTKGQTHQWEQNHEQMLECIEKRPDVTLSRTQEMSGNKSIPTNNRQATARTPSDIKNILKYLTKRLFYNIAETRIKWAMRQAHQRGSGSYWMEPCILLEPYPWTVVGAMSIFGAASPTSRSIACPLETA